MADIVIPNTLNFARARFRLIENVGVSRALYTGRTRTSELGGDRIGCSLEATPSMAAQRAALKSFAMQAGRRNRVYLYDPGYRPRGSFPATELLTNADFSQGTTGWTFTNATGAVANGVLRIKRSSVPGGTFAFGQQVLSGLTQFAAYAGRVHVVAASPAESQVGVSIFAGSPVSVGAAGNVYTAASVLATGTTANLYLDNTKVNGVSVGDFWDVGFTSFSRVALADSGVNVWDRAEEIENAAWTKFQTTITANAFTSYDGTAATADRIVETTATAEHYVARSYTKSAVSARYCGWAILGVGTLANARTRARLTLYGASGSDSISADVNLATGAIITGPAAAGTFTNGQIVVKSMGAGWFLFEVIGTTGAESTVQFSVNLMSGASINYAGSTTGDISCAGIGLAPSAVALRPVRTTTTAATGANQVGYGIHVKGLPASTNGLLLFGDWVEITTSQGSELKMLTADLDSDAAGLGFLQFAPALRGTVADNAPIIVHRPMGRFISTADAIEYQDEPGIITTSSFDFEEG